MKMIQFKNYINNVTRKLSVSITSTKIKLSCKADLTSMIMNYKIYRSLYVYNFIWCIYNIKRYFRMINDYSENAL